MISGLEELEMLESGTLPPAVAAVPDH